MARGHATHARRHLPRARRCAGAQPRLRGGHPMTIELTATPNNKGVDAAVAAARRVIETLLHAGDNSAAEMSEVADRLNAVADHLEDHVPTVQQRLVDMWGGEGVTRHDPVTGPENAIAPPLHLI